MSGLLTQLAGQSLWQESVRPDRKTPPPMTDYFGGLGVVPTAAAGPGKAPKGAKGSAVDGVWLGNYENTGRVSVPKSSKSGILDAELPTVKDTRAKTRQVIAVQDALDLPWSWSDARWAKEMERASKVAGEPIQTRKDYLDIWGQAVSWANAAQRAGKPITPFQAMNLMARETAAVIKAGNRTHTSTTTSVDTITDGQAWSTLTSAVKDAIGRAPTTSELHRFIGKAKDIAASNPRVTTTTSSEDTKGNSRSTSTSKGGVTGDDLALAAHNMAATPEAAAYQAATTYMGALMSVLDGPVDLNANF